MSNACQNWGTRLAEERRYPLPHFRERGIVCDKILIENYGSAWAALEGSTPISVLTVRDVKESLMCHPDVEAVTSHLARLTLPSAVNVFPIVFLRDPIDRARSAYAYERRAPSNVRSSEIAKQGDFRNYVIRMASCIFLRRANVISTNYQTLARSASSLRERAINNPKQRDWPYISLLLLFTLLVFWKIVFTRQYSVVWSGDAASEYFPRFQSLASSLHHYSFPFWNQHSEAGRLYIGESTAGPFYPLNLLVALLPLNGQGLLRDANIGYFVVFHFFLASLLTYFLARHLGLSRFSAMLSGIVFAYSGSLSLRFFAQINLFAASIWIPGVFLFFSKSLRAPRLRQQLLFANLGGLMLAFCLFAGHHQPLLYCSTAIGITALVLAFSKSLSLYDSPQVNPSQITVLRTSVLLFAFALVYSSLQLIPMLQYSHYAYRWVGSELPIIADRNTPYVLAGSLYRMAPESILNMVFPGVTSPENDPYFGILPLFLVAFSLTVVKRSRLARLLWVIAIVFFLFSFGDRSVVHGILYNLLPGYGKAREPARGLLMMHFSFSLLAGLGCDSLFSPFRKKGKVFKLRLIQGFAGFSVAVTFLILGFYLYAALVLQAPWLPGRYAADTSSTLSPLVLACLLLLATSVLALARFYAGVRWQPLKIAVIAILILDFHALVTTEVKPKSGYGRDGNMDAPQYYQADEVVHFLQSQPSLFRTDFLDPHYARNMGDVDNLDTVDGYGATRLQRFARMFEAERAYDLLNVKYIVSTYNLPLRKVFENNRTKIFENLTALPRAWLVTRVDARPSLEEVISALKEPGRDFAQEALVEGSLNTELNVLASNTPGVPVTHANDVSDVHFESQGPNRFSVRTPVSRPSLLVVSESWYPDWIAKVNGLRHQVWQVDGGLMGVYLDPGPATVEFVFRPSYLYAELALVALALAVLAATCFERW